MPFLNLNTGVLLYADSNVENPKIRLADVTDTFQQIIINNVRSNEIIIEPNESETIANTQRTLATITSTVFSFTRPIDVQPTMRVEWTSGADPVFRTLRNIGIDTTTHIAISRVGPRSMKIESISGTPITTTSVFTGDVVWFERNSDSYTSPFNAYNVDRAFIVQSKGVNSIIVNDEGIMAEENDVTISSTADLKIFVQPLPTSVKLNDYINITTSAYNFYNRGIFKILRVTDKYLEFENPYGVIESVTNSTNGLVVFDYLIRFAHIIANGEIELRFDGNSSGLTITPLNHENSQFTASLKSTQILATNNTMNAISVRCQFAGIVGE